MSALVPPRRWRLRFWLLGLRLPVEYRPWVYEQVVAPGFGRRRRWTTLLILSVGIVLPQGATALAERSWGRAVLPGGYLLLLLGLALARRSMSEAQLRMVLGYHGLNRAGGLIEPMSVWAGNPLGKAGLALLCAQVLLFSSGVAIAADRLSARHDCKPVPAASLAAVSADIGVPRPGGPFPIDIPGVPRVQPIAGVMPGTPLLYARQIRTPFDGIHYVAAYVRTDSGRLVGPAVWEVIEPYTTFALATRQIKAEDATARALAPSLGFSFGGPPDPLVGKARDCARAAR